MNLVYGIHDRPPMSKVIVFAFQQMIAIMAATLLVPILMTQMGLVASPAAALFGAGLGTIVYLLFTKRRSPVFLGSSFTFLGAYGAVISQNYGYWGVLIGVAFAGLVYVIFALIIKFVGSGWVNKLMPAVIIGPIVTLIGLSLSSTATSWLSANNGSEKNISLLSIAIGLVTFFAIVVASVKGNKTVKLIPFIIGIGVGYGVALIFTIIGLIAKVEALQIIDFTPFVDIFGNGNFKFFGSILDLPDFFLVRAIQTSIKTPDMYSAIDFAAIGNIALIFIPIGVVELAQHVADHKNLGTIIGKDLVTDPGLDKTLLGDGVGSIAGSIFGCCANTTYGESIGCVAITGNASVITIFTAAIGCMLLSFFAPFVALINTIPKCVMGGACIALYGFIAVSGLQMLKKVDLGNSKNLFVVSSILVTGIGGLTLNFGFSEITQKPILTITSLATALIVGLITNLIVNNGKVGEVDETTDGLTGATKSMGDVEVEPTVPAEKETVSVGTDTDNGKAE